MNKLYCIMFLFLSGCGVAENISKTCVGSDLEQGCNTLFGYRDNDQDVAVNDLRGKVSALEKQSSLLLSSIYSLQSSVDSINNVLPTLASGAALTSLTARVVALEGQIGTPVTGLQAIVTQNTATILQLQSNYNVTNLIDPCGNGPGYDEIFLRTSTGKIIASFSDSASGLNTRFSELTAGGPYSTTDGTGCTFTVSPDVDGKLQIISTPATVEY